MKSIEGNFNNPKVNELLNKHFIELRSVSPAGSTHVLDITGLKDQSIKFWSLWDNDELIGCGALKFLDKIHGEFKSIRVDDKFRKKGAGEKIFNQLIEEANKFSVLKKLPNLNNFNVILFCVGHSYYKNIRIKKLPKKPIYFDLNRVLSFSQI